MLEEYTLQVLDSGGGGQGGCFSSLFLKVAATVREGSWKDGNFPCGSEEENSDLPGTTSELFAENENKNLNKRP